MFAARAVFDERLCARDVRVLAALGTFTDRQGWCHPSQATIAKRIGAQRSHVNTSIKTLVKTGYVQAVKQVKDNGAQTVNLYRVLLDLSAPEAAYEAADAAIVPVRLMDPPLSISETPRDLALHEPKQSQPVVPPVQLMDTPRPPNGHPPVHYRDTELTQLEGKKRATRLPATWAPRKEEIDFGVQGGLSEAEVRAAADHMRDWAASSPKASKLDWDRTFRNWLRTTVSDAKRGRRPVVTSTASSDLQNRLALFAYDGTWHESWGPPPSKAQGGTP